MTERKEKQGRRWLWMTAVCLAVALRLFVFSPYIVEGKSMMPTLENGNWLVVNKLSYDIGPIHRFDVIVFHATRNEDYVKRVIGLPGDRIEYKNDVLYVNGKRMDEPYLRPYKQRLAGGKLTGDFTLEEVTGKTRVPPGCVFVLGDNRLGSWDSRHFGFVKISRIVGKVDLRYWPLNEFAFQF
ncbi:signal peptidase I [Geobacillus icigianus]|uniref:Signal peptidase I n=1 Tax=Geobacillus subterraneus TaxID=129338 RepID=A0A679FMJ3_9BACL|nr:MULTISPECIES: signal peptidase I [Geobacillus]KYD28705.1 Signal peptidase I [Geobacillus sp. B4113_201601]BBW97203.1 signal peptidase I [Geobacillus subterraneus]